MSDAALVAGRECGACMMCCKLPAIRALTKPAARWCAHAAPGRGCRIYADRPDECSAFYCRWRRDATMGPEWKPDRAKFLIQSKNDREMAVLVDPGSPQSWKQPPYYDALKILAARLFEAGGLLTVHVGQRVTVVLPERDLDAGNVPDDHTIDLLSRVVNGVTEYEVRATPAGRPGS